MVGALFFYLSSRLELRIGSNLKFPGTTGSVLYSARWQRLHCDSASSSLDLLDGQLTGMKTSSGTFRVLVSRKQRYYLSCPQFHAAASQRYAQVVSDVPTRVEKGKGKGKDGKERLVILGSGWGAMTLLKNLDQVCPPF